MILANLRASAWKYGCIAVGVLGVALLIAAVVFRFDANRANTRADTAEGAAKILAGRLAQAKLAAKHDDLGVSATAQARASADTRLTQHNDRAARVEGIAHAPRAPDADGCSMPDPDLVRELEAGADRVLTAEGRLRSLSGPASAVAKPSGAR